MYTLLVISLPNFSSLGWFLYSSAFDSCYQLLTANDSSYEKKLTRIFIYTLKLILVLNFSSLAWFPFSSAVNSCYQLLKADDSCYEKKLNGIFIFPLKLISVPNFSSAGCLGAWLESVTVDCWRSRSQSRSHQARLELLRLSWAGACAWVEQ